MKNKTVCTTCKGTKVYQVSNLEFEECSECKGKGYIIEKDMKNVFLLGRWTETTWEVLGIFPDLKTSLKCLKEGYFVVEIPFNEFYGEDKMEVVSYQIVDGKVWLVDIDGTMLEEVDVEKLTM